VTRFSKMNHKLHQAEGRKSQVKVFS